MARRALERDMESGGGNQGGEDLYPPDTWGRPWGHPEYGVPPVDPNPPPPPPPEVPKPPVIDGGGTPRPPENTGGSNLGSLLQPYGGSFQRPDMAGAAREAISWLPALPDFDAPAAPDPFQAPAAFSAPKGNDIYEDPGYQFRLDQGMKALEASASGKGTLRTGGTLKDLINYGQQFASNEYRGLYDRRLGEHQMNWNNSIDAYRTGLDRYDRQLAGARASYEPNILRYTTEAQVGQRAAENAYDRAWNEYMQGYNSWRNQQNDVFDRLKWQSEFGLDAARG